MSKFSASNLNITQLRLVFQPKIFQKQVYKMLKLQKLINVLRSIKRNRSSVALLEIGNLNCEGEIEIDNNSIYRNVNH